MIIFGLGYSFFMFNRANKRKKEILEWLEKNPKAAKPTNTKRVKPSSNTNPELERKKTITANKAIIKKNHGKCKLTMISPVCNRSFTVISNLAAKG